MKNQLLFDRPVPNGWKLISVDEVKSEEPKSCVAGPFGSSISSKYFVESGVPVIRGSNLRTDLTRFISENFVFVSEAKAKEFQAQHVKPDDLVFTCWGTLGQVGLIPHDGPYPEYIISNKQLKLRPNKKIASPLFLFYYFANPLMVSYINSIALGAAVPGINLGILKELKVCLPPLQIQNRIVSILSIYDDLIENNTRRIAIFEEMARKIYTEWFVHFRFPGYEKVKMVDNELGRIPSGWKVLPLERLIKKHIGGGWGKDVVDRVHTDKAFVVRGTDIPSAKVGDLSGCPLRFHKPSNLSSRKLQHFDIVFEASGGSHSQNVGRTLLVLDDLLHCFNGEVMCASFCKLIRTDREVVGPLYVYHHLSHLYDTEEIAEFQVQSTGIKNFQFKAFIEKHGVVIPSNGIQQEYEKALLPIHQMIVALGKKNSILRQTRDLLLPRLISGEIDVSEMEIAA